MASMLLGYTPGIPEDGEMPRDVTRGGSSSGDGSWLLRFFDSAFFCEWIAVSYLYRYEHGGVRDYLCNRMYALPLAGMEGYLFQLTFMLIHHGSPSLERYVVHLCTRSLRIALKVHWLLLAEIEDAPDVRLRDQVDRVRRLCEEAAIASLPATPWKKGKGSKSDARKKFGRGRRLLNLPSLPSLSSSSSIKSPALPAPIKAEGERKESPGVSMSSPRPEEKEAELSKSSSLRRLMPKSKSKDSPSKPSSKEKEAGKKEREKEKEKEKEKSSPSCRTPKGEGAKGKDSFWKRLWRDKGEEEEGDEGEELSRPGTLEGTPSFCKSEDDADGDVPPSPSLVSRSEGEGEGERSHSFKGAGSASEDERPGFWKRRLTFSHSDREKEGESMAESESADEKGSRRRSSRRFRWRSRRDARERSVESSGDSSADEREGGSRSFGGSWRDREPHQKLETIGDSGNEAGSSMDEGEERPGQRDTGAGAVLAEGLTVLADVAEAAAGPGSDCKVGAPVKQALASPGLKLEVTLPDNIPDSRSETTTPTATPDRVGDFSPNERHFGLPHSHPEASSSSKAAQQEAGASQDKQMVAVKVEKGGKNGFRLAALLWGNGDVAVARLKKLEQEAAAREQQAGLTSPQTAALPVAPARRGPALPRLPKHPSFSIRHGIIHATQDFVRALCDASSGLVDVYPMADRQLALRQTLAELNTHLDLAGSDSGMVFPMGSSARIVHVPEDEAVLLNSRDKAPFMICVEVLKYDDPSASKKEPAPPAKLFNGGLTAWWRQANGGGASPGRLSWDGSSPTHLPWALSVGPPDLRPGAELLAQADPSVGSLVDLPGQLVEVGLKVGRRRKGRAVASVEGKGSIKRGPSMKAGLPPVPTAVPIHRRMWSFGSLLEGYESETVGSAPGEGGSHTGSRNPSESGSVSTGEAEVRLGLAPFDDARQRHEGDPEPDSPGTETSARVVPTCSSDPDEAFAEDEEWVTVTLRAVPGASMSEFAEEAEGKKGGGPKKHHRRIPSAIAFAEAKAVAAKGMAPPVPSLPAKAWASVLGSSESVAVPPNNAAALADATEVRATAAETLGERWEEKKARIRRKSQFGKSSAWDLRSVIVKSGDDCRQEHLAAQLVAHFADIYSEAGLPLWLRPYEVLVTSSRTALIETITDAISIHAVKSRSAACANGGSLRDHFLAKYGKDTPAFSTAQTNFVESMAGYSILSYLLQVKDRHNGNILLDEDGHIIHIDFGFMLSNSPGGVNFESAPFKLTRELLEVMDSDAEGSASEAFLYFQRLCIHGFLACRKHAERIIVLIEMMQNSGCPCFKGGARSIQNLRKRFALTFTEQQCVSLVLSMINSSLDAWRTRQYDYYQRVLNGIL